MESVLVRSQVVPAELERVVEFFEDPRNLEAITPPFLGFRILSPEPVVMRRGAIIDYALQLYGVPLRWRSRIDEYLPGEMFVDVQLQGPYKRWHHTHRFTRVPDGTCIEDTVRYEVPFGWLGRIAQSLFVRRSLQAIFDYRERVVAKRFAEASL